jgi:ribosome-associated protein
VTNLLGALRSPPSSVAAMRAGRVQDPYLHVGHGIRIALTEIDVRTSTSGGPGGQHANRAHTRIEVVFDVAASNALDERQRAMLIERVGPTVRARSSQERSQLRNRNAALERLGDRIDAALRTRRTRRPTAPSHASVNRRLDAKRRNSVRKVERRRPNDSQ